MARPGWFAMSTRKPKDVGFRACNNCGGNMRFVAISQETGDKICHECKHAEEKRIYY